MAPGFTSPTGPSRPVLALDPDDLRVVAKIPVGEHPNQIALHPTDDRLFVACASTNCVSVIDTKLGIVTETIMTRLVPALARRQHAGRRGGRARRQDALRRQRRQQLRRRHRHRACPNQSQVKGFIPTGWYPTAVAVTPDSKTLLVGVGKGNQTQAQSRRPQGGSRPTTASRSGRRCRSPTSARRSCRRAVDRSGARREAAGRVHRDGLSQLPLLRQAADQRRRIRDKTAIPTKVGEPSPIKHVIYIIKENRTYDQVFGDIKKGNGDPSLVMFGEKVTPNHHKLAHEFVLLDNLYCNGQVSRDGHPWSTMAYNTDYIARDWHLTYSQRKGVDDDDEGNLSKAPVGLSLGRLRPPRPELPQLRRIRRARQPAGRHRSRWKAACPAWSATCAPTTASPRSRAASVRDTDNVDVFLKEFREFEKNDKLPRFIVMSLGEDHTTGTTPGTFTPQACVASNDLALGRLVEAVSQSKYWPRDRHLRHRGRRPERPRPRGRPSHGRPGHQPVHQAALSSTARSTAPSA